MKREPFMSQLRVLHQISRPRLALKLLAFALLVCVGLLVYAKTARRAQGPFAQAEDFPRGALVYAQFSDLPALVKRWNDSALKEQYLSSTNFQQLSKSHLWLKLSERWEEFNNALGFTLDADSLAGTTENRAAIAVYDIGRLDLVLVAPLSDEKLAATKFFESREQFEETTLPDGTVYYRLDVDADRGRQKQQLTFASLRGRFVLATNERLLLRTLANINARAQKDRLTDDPAFKSLSEKVSPHFMSVWVDQSKLNQDYYFKHYWLMRNTEQLKNIRACLFDLELQEGRWIERRDLLYASGKASRKRPSIPGPEARRLAAMIPGGVPYFKLRALDGSGGDGSGSGNSEGSGEETYEGTPAALVRDAFLDRLAQDNAGAEEDWDSQAYSSTDFEFAQGEQDEEWSGESRYTYLDGDYDSSIDDPHDAGLTGREEPGDNPLRAESEGRFMAGLRGVLVPAHPLWAATLTSPQTMKGSLFVEFRQAAILTLRSPGSLKHEALESAVNEAVASRLLTAGSSASLKWTSAEEGTERWRQLELPMLGWEVCYAVKGQDLIVSNNVELLRSILAGEARAGSSDRELARDGGASNGMDDLTVIDLNQRAQAFHKVFEQLDAEAVARYWKLRAQSQSQSEAGVRQGTSQEFFSGNLSSLLGVASAVGRVEIKRNSLPDRLHEEIDFILK